MRPERPDACCNVGIRSPDLTGETLARRLDRSASRIPGVARVVLTRVVFISCALFALSAVPARAGSAAESTRTTGSREYLVPELAEDPFRLSDGAPSRTGHLSFAPAIGRLGSDPFHQLRVGYSPGDVLGYEISLGHNPSSSSHAVFHTLDAILRLPLPGRFQPFGDLGFGMMTVFPGNAINADPVTKNALAAGGGLEIRIRNDVSLRGDLRLVTVVGQDRGETDPVAYRYRQFAIGLSFARRIG